MVNRFYILLTQLIVGLIFLEIGLSLINFSILKINENNFLPYTKIYLDERSKDYLYWHKNNVDVTLERGEHTFRFITNNYGHRATDDEINFNSSILFIGDSIIEGASLENHETLPALIENNLKIPTINLGFGASNTVQQYYLLKDKYLPNFNSKLVVLGFCLNDIPQNTFRRYFDSKVGNWRFYDRVTVNLNNNAIFFSSNNIDVSMWQRVKDFVKQSQAITLIYKLFIKASNFNTSDQKSTDIHDESSWVNTEFFINKIRSFVTSKDSKFVVILYPTKKQLEGKESLQDIIKLSKILEKNKIDYFDPSEALLSHQKNTSNFSNLYHDNVHPNALGSKIIADSFMSFLLNKDYF